MRRLESRVDLEAGMSVNPVSAGRSCWSAQRDEGSFGEELERAAGRWFRSRRTRSTSTSAVAMAMVPVYVRARGRACVWVGVSSELLVLV